MVAYFVIEAVLWDCQALQKTKEYMNLDEETFTEIFPLLAIKETFSDSQQSTSHFE